ncbi:hypothetical protein [Rhodococcus koreensis]
MSSSGATCFPFIKPWSPSERLYVERLKRWQADDQRDLSLERDIRTARMLREFFVTEGQDLDRFEDECRELADIGYAGYFFSDYADVSMHTLLDAYQYLARQHAGNDEFDAVYRWKWLEELLDDAKPLAARKTKIAFKTPGEPYEDGTFFGRQLHLDARFPGVPVGETQKFLEESIAREFATYHPGYAAATVPSRELVVLALMDLMDDLEPASAHQSLARRMPFARGFRDVGIGRKFARGEVGRIWVNYDNSIGLDTDPGQEHPRTGFALGAAKSVSP